MRRLERTPTLEERAIRNRDLGFARAGHRERARRVHWQVGIDLAEDVQFDLVGLGPVEDPHAVQSLNDFGVASRPSQDLHSRVGVISELIRRPVPSTMRMTCSDAKGLRPGSGVTRVISKDVWIVAVQSCRVVFELGDVLEVAADDDRARHVRVAVFAAQRVEMLDADVAGKPQGLEDRLECEQHGDQHVDAAPILAALVKAPGLRELFGFGEDQPVNALQLRIAP